MSNDQRNLEIARAIAAGTSLRCLGLLHGLSAEAIRKIGDIEKLRDMAKRRIADLAKTPSHISPDTLRSIPIWEIFCDEKRALNALIYQCGKSNPDTTLGQVIDHLNHRNNPGESYNAQARLKKMPNLGPKSVDLILFRLARLKIQLNDGQLQIDLARGRPQPGRIEAARALLIAEAPMLWGQTGQTSEHLLEKLQSACAQITTSQPADEQISNSSMAYLSRWHVQRKAEGAIENIYIHQFSGPDEIAWHNHPWSSQTLILKGAYAEHGSAGTQIHEQGDFYFRSADEYHSIRLVMPETTTLFITGPKTQEWGFLPPQCTIPQRSGQ